MGKIKLMEAVKEATHKFSAAFLALIKNRGIAVGPTRFLRHATSAEGGEKKTIASVFLRATQNRSYGTISWHIMPDNARARNGALKVMGACSFRDDYGACLLLGIKNPDGGRN